MSWEEMDKYLNKTRYLTSLNDLDTFLFTDLKNTDLKVSIPYEDENESRFRPRRNLYSLYEESEEKINYTVRVDSNKYSEYLECSQPNKKIKLSG